MSGARFVRFYPSDWRSGCLGLTFEQEGLYIRICAYIYETGRRLPLDNSVAAKFMGAHTNAYRKIIGQLAELGKVTRYDDGWSVERAEHELAAAVGTRIGTDPEKPSERSVDQGSDGETCQDTLGDTPHNTPIVTPLDTMGVFAKNDNEINAPSLEPIANSQKPLEKKETTPPVAVSREVAKWELISQACMTAIGAAADPNAIGLIAVGEPQAWIADGADLELDVLPAIRKLAAQQIARGGTINGWNYFARAVAQHKANRLAGLPVAAAELAKPRMKVGRYGMVPA